MNGQSILDTEQISAKKAVELEGSFVVADAENPSGFQTATAFCAVYDHQGNMVCLQTWEVDMSDPRNICFMGNIHIPEGVSVGEIRIMILSDDMIPLRVPGML